MALQSQFFVANSNTRTYPSTKHIPSKKHMAVFLKRISFIPPETEWVEMSYDDYDLINNTAVFNVAVDSNTYSVVEVRVADNPDELLGSQTDLTAIASVRTQIELLSKVVSQIALLGNQQTVDAILSSVQNATDAAQYASIAQNASDMITNMSVITGAAGTIASWNGTTGELTIPRGDTGYSNYDLWIMEGNSGTVTDYLGTLGLTFVDGGNF